MVTTRAASKKLSDLNHPTKKASATTGTPTPTEDSKTQANPKNERADASVELRGRFGVLDLVNRKQYRAHHLDGFASGIGDFMSLQAGTRILRARPYRVVPNRTGWNTWHKLEKNKSCQLMDTMKADTELIQGESTKYLGRMMTEPSSFFLKLSPEMRLIIYHHVFVDAKYLFYGPEVVCRWPSYAPKFPPTDDPFPWHWYISLDYPCDIRFTCKQAFVETRDVIRKMQVSNLWCSWTPPNHSDNLPPMPRVPSAWLDGVKKLELLHCANAKSIVECFKNVKEVIFKHGTLELHHTSLDQVVAENIVRGSVEFGGLPYTGYERVARSPGKGFDVSVKMTLECSRKGHSYRKYGQCASTCRLGSVLSTRLSMYSENNVMQHVKPPIKGRIWIDSIDILCSQTLMMNECNSARFTSCTAE